MRVLFLVYPRIGLNRGGLQIQIEKTAEGLAKLGVEVLFYDPWKNQIEDVDICHVFSIDTSMSYHIRRAKEMERPIVASPVFNVFEIPAWLIKLKVMLSENVPGMRAGLALSKFMLKSSQRVLALNGRERDLLISVFGLESQKCTVIPNGINKTFGSGAPKLFEEKYGIKDYILEVGAVGRRKNQLTLIKAVAGLPYSLVIIGGPAGGDESYMNQCKEIAGDNVFFMGEISNDDPLLASAFAAAKLFVLPSYSEVMPLTLYEAAIAGCKIIASQNVPVSEEISTHVQTFNPDDVNRLIQLIDHEMKTPKNNMLMDIAAKLPTWMDVAERIKDVYEGVLSEKQPQGPGVTV